MPAEVVDGVARNLRQRPEGTELWLWRFMLDLAGADDAAGGAEAAGAAGAEAGGDAEFAGSQLGGEFHGADFSRYTA